MLVEGKGRFLGISIGTKIVEAGQTVKLNNVPGGETDRRMTPRHNRVEISYVNRLSQTAGTYSLSGAEMPLKNLTSGRIIKRTYTERV